MIVLAASLPSRVPIVLKDGEIMGFTGVEGMICSSVEEAAFVMEVMVDQKLVPEFPIEFWRTADGLAV